MTGGLRKNKTMAYLLGSGAGISLSLGCVAISGLCFTTAWWAGYGGVVAVAGSFWFLFHRADVAERLYRMSLGDRTEQEIRFFGEDAVDLGVEERLDAIEKLLKRSGERERLVNGAIASTAVIGTLCSGFGEDLAALIIEARTGAPPAN